MKCQLHISTIDKKCSNNEILKNVELMIIKAISKKNINFNKRIEKGNVAIYDIDLAENHTTGELSIHIYLQYKYIMDLNKLYNIDNIKINIIGLEELPKKIVFKHTFNDQIDIIKLSSLFGKEALTTGFRTTNINSSYDTINKIAYIKSNFIFLLLLIDNWYSQYSSKCLITVEG